ncbi:hypothetical protein [Aliidiomarina celeris]|uniref:hypothetical protein n=1 Tax=Aliidiomarina celeris TaxID=2249428 RepID=UPI000DEBF217|nr:hypothetical protein [Aliidiomarina celeris]
MLSVELQSAIANLKINDVYIDKIDAVVTDRSFNFDEQKFDIEHKFGVKAFELKDLQEQKAVCFSFEAGVRWLSSPKRSNETDDDKDQQVIARIECVIVGCYLMKELVSEEALREFAIKNCGFHVWPYWREFLTSQSERLRLPRVMLPITQFQALNDGEPKKSGTSN